MELHLILDGGAGTLNEPMWLENSSPSPPYRELSPNHETIGGTISIQQAIIPSSGYHSPSSCQVDGAGGVVGDINWEDKRSDDDDNSGSYSPNRGLIRTTSSPNGSSSQQQQQQQQQQIRGNVETTTTTTTTTITTISENLSNHQERNNRNDDNTITLKRRSGENLQNIHDDQHHHGRKIIKRYGSVNNDSRQQGWSSQVEDFAEHLVADFDGSLSALAANDLATALASYNVSEALLALPSLTVFKQEAPSPDNHQSNPSLNHVSQRGGAIDVPSTGGNGSSTVIDVMEADSNNNNNNSQNTGNPGQTNAASLHQLLYSNDNDYSTTSSVQGGNQVSSSQQGNETNEDCRFQYVLAAATSIATKINEETLTYLNQGQSYEIKLKKLGDLSAYRGKILKSSIRICFHERRLQYTEREQMLSWQKTRPGERLLEVDVPLSYGTVDVRQPSNSGNIVEFMWDPTKEVGVYIKVNCISTEFTPKKHGGEKGVPFRIQVETRIAGGCRLHAASCQVKVFKLKGADRKHKQDRDKVLRRPRHEQDKYQPSYDCTVLSDIPLECLTTTTPASPEHQNRSEICGGSPFAPSDAATPQTRSAMGGSSSPIAAPLPICINPSAGLLPIVSTNPEAAKEAVTPSNSVQSPTVSVSPLKNIADTNQAMSTTPTSLSPDSNASQTSSWLRAGRFDTFESTFSNFSASDILRLSRDDLIQICGLPDGIRLFNALHSKPSAPRLTLYFSAEGSGALWRAVYLDTLTSAALASKLHGALGGLGPPQDRLHSVVIIGPQGIHVLVTDELVANMKDESMFIIETVKDANTERYKILMKPSSR